jgi:hypothetical protein
VWQLLEYRGWSHLGRAFAVSKSSQESSWLVPTRLLHTNFQTITHLPFSNAWFSGIGGVATAVSLLRRLQ